MSIWFWFWVVLAAVLLVLEIFTAGFFMLPFAIGSAAAAALEFFAPESFTWQWVLFLGLSSVLLVVMRRFAESITHEPPEMVGVDRMLGKTGVVTEALEPHSSDGQVRIAREEWRAETPDGTALDVGSSVRVERIEGTRLIVVPIEDGQVRSDEEETE